MSLNRNSNSANLLTRVVYLIAVFLSFNPCLAQESSLNALDLYQTEALATCRFTAIDQSDALWIYAKLNFEQPVPVEDSLWISYHWESSGLFYEDSILFKSPDRRQLRLKWEFGTADIPPTMTVRVFWKGRAWIFQDHFPMRALHPSGDISLWKSNSPLFDHWIHSNDSVLIKSMSSDHAYAYYYNHHFNPTRPPMAMRSSTGNETLTIDSIFTLSSGVYFNPKSPGLYFLQSDSTTTSGRALLVTDSSFPRPREITDLVEPLIYITTRGEFQKLKKDLTNKPAFDKFWLSTVRSPEKARKAIKNYYHNVEVANILFSSYKEGWKTDRGMIYCVLGAPLMVTKELETETWTYKDVTGEELYFSFRKIRNIFSNNHYELIRDKSYDRVWFLAIDRWREGQIN